MTVLFRAATRADLPAILALLADDPLGAAREGAAGPVAACYADAFDAMADDANQMLAVAEEAGAVIGTLQLTFIPGLSRRGAWRGQIEAVRVARDRRGAGIGGAFIDWAIDRCRARGCALVQLTSDRTREDAHRFYARRGFGASHIGYKLKLRPR